MTLYICTKFQENISKGFKVIKRAHTEIFRVIKRMQFCILKFSKGHNSVNSVDGVMVLILSTLSDDVLYLYQVLSK